NSEEEQENQEDLPENLKKTEKEPEDNDSNNVEKDQVRKYKNILKKFGKLLVYKRPRVETSEIEQEDQEVLSEQKIRTKLKTSWKIIILHPQ
ncbi:5685_t:CDS:2, partial [Gigaspora margarita]